MHVPREDATGAKGVDERLAITQRIFGNEVTIRGDQRAEILAESDVHRWAVVDRADANGEEVRSQFAGLLGENVLEIDRCLSWWQASSAGGGEADIALDLAPVNRHPRLEDRLHQHLADGMRFHRRVVFPYWLRRVGHVLESRA